MHAGNPELLGATPDDSGTNFAIYSAVADGVELCLFDGDGQQVQIHHMPDCQDGVWNGYLPGCRAGQHYGYRIHGPYDPAKGLRCNAAKLLLDPYAREIAGGNHVLKSSPFLVFQGGGFTCPIFTTAPSIRTVDA